MRWWAVEKSASLDGQLRRELYFLVQTSEVQDLGQKGLHYGRTCQDLIFFSHSLLEREFSCGIICHLCSVASLRYQVAGSHVGPGRWNSTTAFR